MNSCLDVINVNNLSHFVTLSFSKDKTESLLFTKPFIFAALFAFNFISIVALVIKQHFTPSSSCCNYPSSRLSWIPVRFRFWFLWWFLARNRPQPSTTHRPGISLKITETKLESKNPDAWRKKINCVNKVGLILLIIIT